jgi:hypothetical protein
MISADGNPLVRRCQIHDGKKFGVSVQNKGQGKILDCAIFGNAAAGVTINEGGDPVLRQCHINRNGAEGVRAHPRALGTVEFCDLTGNAAGAWSLQGGCRLQRSGNKE